ncbi:MAG: spore germination protein [Firmicutes bacterium]|jgi:stage V sporulation protein AF|nr:spore germination protein [Bacillota bacterium]
MKIHKDLDRNLDILTDRLGIGISFDLILRKIKVGNKDAALLFLDGFVQDKTTQAVIEALIKAKPEELVPNTVKKLMENQIPYFEIANVDSIDELIQEVLAGPMALLIDGVSQALIIDVRQYPGRSIEEPELERVTRGARDGFVETGLFNVNLIRRRLRDPGLRFEAVEVGERSPTDVFIGYIDDIVNPKLLNELKRRFEKMQPSALPMGSKSVEEYLFGTKINPFPVVRYTERPDVVAAHLLEGHMVVITDTTPAAMILPVTAWHFTQHAEDYFNNPVVGTYIRWLRFAAFIMAFLLTPVWLSLAQNRSTLPPALRFIGPKGVASVPLFLQFTLLELAVDLTRMAFIHTPSAIATSLGLVAAILLGQFAVDVGLFIPETILYQSIAAIAYFAIPNYEFGMATRLFRLLVLVLVGFFSYWGLAVGLAITLLVMGFTKSLGLPYLWPLIPFHGPSFLRLLFRYPIPAISQRPPFTRPTDADVKGREAKKEERKSELEESPLPAAMGIKRRVRKVGRRQGGESGKAWDKGKGEDEQ